jgi:hypothetical protein
MSTRELVREIDELVGKVTPLMRAYQRNAQWGALAELTAIWLDDHAGVEPRLLEPLLRVHIKAIRTLVVSRNRQRNAKLPQVNVGGLFSSVQSRKVWKVKED